MPRLLNLKFALALTLALLASILVLSPLHAQAPYHRFRPHAAHTRSPRATGVSARGHRPAR